MTGFDSHRVYALPHDRLQEVLRRTGLTTCPGALN